MRYIGSLLPGTDNDLDRLLTTSEDTSDQWQDRAHHHDACNDIKRRSIIWVTGCPKACNQYRANNSTCTPSSKHYAVNCTRILWPEKISGKSRHCAKTTSVAQSNNGCRYK